MGKTGRTRGLNSLYGCFLRPLGRDKGRLCAPLINPRQPQYLPGVTRFPARFGSTWGCGTRRCASQTVLAFYHVNPPMLGCVEGRDFRAISSLLSPKTHIQGSGCFRLARNRTPLYAAEHCRNITRRSKFCLRARSGRVYLLRYILKRTGHPA